MTKRPTRIPVCVCKQHRSRQRPLRLWIHLDQLSRKDLLCWSLRGRNGEWCVKYQQICNGYRWSTTSCRLFCVIYLLLLLQENFDQKHDLLIEETELKQVAYIFHCNNCTLQIKGKINSIIIGELSLETDKKKKNIAMIPDSDSWFGCILLPVLDNCKKLGLVFENVVGIVEIINSKSVQLQVRKRLWYQNEDCHESKLQLHKLATKYLTQPSEIDPYSQLLFPQSLFHTVYLLVFNLHLCVCIFPPDCINFQQALSIRICDTWELWVVYPPPLTHTHTYSS